ncbi:MAG: hypothetical protein E7624_02615 [Ruminococcaceae bacterium]|nr:hypothetical protein [Oscillospiraceae bacterium]
MVEEKVFSFTRFVKYMLSKILILVICAVLGAGVGLLLTVGEEKQNYEKYSGRMSFDIVEYAALLKPEGHLSEGDFSAIEIHLTQIIESCRTSDVIAKTYEQVKDRLYPTWESETARNQAFYVNFLVTNGTNALNIIHYYDVRNDEDRACAVFVIDTYLQTVRETLQVKYPELAGDAYDKVVTVSEVVQDRAFSVELQTKNQRQSVLAYILIGAVAGAVVGGGVILALYLFGTRLKSTADVLPADKATVIRADDAGAVGAFLARVQAAKARRIAVLTLQKDEKYEAWVAKLQDALQKSGATVKTVTFCAEGTEWISYFKERAVQESDYELYLYNDDSVEIASCLAGQAELSAFFFNQSEVKAKKLEQGVAGISGDSYSCTLIHSTNRSYLD